MDYLIFNCPPMPHFILGGECRLRPGDAHERRTIHNTFDLIYVVSGALSLAQDGVEFTLEPGQFGILYPDTQHKGSRVCTGPTQYYWLHFYTEGTYEHSDSPPFEKPVHRANLQTYYVKKPFHIFLPRFGTVPSFDRKELEEHWSALGQVLIDKYTDTKRYPPITRSQMEQQLLFLQILTLLYRPYAQKLEVHGAAQRLRGYLEDHYSEDLPLEQLSQLFSYSPSHLVRSFRKAYQVSPGQYVLQLRIRAALRLLSGTDLSVGRIGEEVGFRSSAYFIKQFKRFTHITPTEYRRAPELYAGIEFPALVAGSDPDTAP